MSKSIKVKVAVTLNVDAQAWQNEFHIDPQSVREDVQGYFANICRQQLELLQCEAKEGAK